jgi:hypothetical protein
MNNEKSKDRHHHKEVGHVSASGKSVVRMSKSGRKYYHNPNKYIPKTARTVRPLEERGKWLNRKDDISSRSKPYCYDKKSEYYMRYWDRKNEIRQEYPKWVHMSREECREYYGRVWDLMQNDEDYKKWKWETRTLIERNKDQWWEEQKEREDEYDGRNDEYDWK